ALGHAAADPRRPPHGAAAGERQAVHRHAGQGHVGGASDRAAVARGLVARARPPGLAVHAVRARWRGRARVLRGELQDRRGALTAAAAQGAGSSMTLWPSKKAYTASGAARTATGSARGCAGSG